MTRPGRPRLGRYALIAAVVVLIGYVAVTLSRHPHHPGGAPASPAVPTPHRTEASMPFPPTGHVFLGVNTGQGPADFTDVDAFTAATGSRPAALQFAVGWAVHTFDRTMFDKVANRGMFPVMSWEPWNYQDSGPAHSHGAQPTYRLDRIASGAFDPYIREFADGVKTLGYQVGIRFAHEMNGFWYPWCEQSNGNHPGDYVRAWRHVHDIFTAAGATNVVWIWSPNVSYPNSTPLRELYPGNSYVDWVGLSGYYGTGGMETYRSFDSIFDKTIGEIQDFTGKPIVVTETGATDSAGRKAEYVRQMFADLPKHPEIIGVIWFEAVKELDWRVAVSPAASAAWRTAAATPRYQVIWSPASIATDSS